MSQRGGLGSNALVGSTVGGAVGGAVGGTVGGLEAVLPFIDGIAAFSTGARAIFTSYVQRHIGIYG